MVDDTTDRRTLEFAEGATRMPVLRAIRGRVGQAGPIAFCLALAGAVAAQSWFRVGTLIASGDSVPTGFLNPAGVLEEGRFLWSSGVTPSGGRGFFAATQTLPAGVASLASAFGLSAPTGQRIFLTLVFAAAGPSMFLLLRTLLPQPDQLPGAGIGALFYAFNPVLLFILPNAVFLAALVLGPLLSALVLRAVREDRWRYPMLLAVASVVMSYVFANPPMAALVAATTLTTAILAVATSADRPVAARSLGRALLIAVPLNLWWMAPALMTLSSAPGQTVTPGAGPFEWSWTHARASLTNILKLTPVWGWPQAEYFPFARDLERPVFVGLRLMPVLAAPASLLILRGARRRVAAAALIGVSLVLVLLAKGLHPPFAGLNAFLYRHVPGMWLFREPTGKFTLVLAAIVALGLALFVWGIGRGAIRSIVVVAMVGAIAATSYPLWTGSVIPDDRPLLPSAHVRFPSYWSEAAAFINADPGPTLLLPADDYYQMPYRWGFYGADLFADELIDAPVVRLIDPSGNAYLEPDPNALEVLEELRRMIGTENWTDASRLAEALGIRWIVVRRDLEADFPGRSIADPDELFGALSASPEFGWVRTFGLLDVFQLDPPRPLVWGTERALVSDPALGSVPLLTLPGEVALVAPEGVPTSGSGIALPTMDADSWLPSPHSLRSEATVPPAAYRVFIRADTGVPAEIELRGSEADRRLEIRTREFVIGRSVTSASLGSVELPTGVEEIPIVSVGRTLLFLRDHTADGAAELAVRPGAHTVVAYGDREAVPLVAPSFEAGASSPLAACNASPGRSSGRGIAAERDSVDGPSSLVLRPGQRSGCAFKRVPLEGREGAYRISFAYAVGPGATPRLCVWERGPDRCVDAPPLETNAGRYRFEYLFRPNPGTSALEIILYADGESGVGKVTYGSVQLERYPPVAVGRLALSPGWIDAGTLRVTEPARLIVPGATVARPSLVDPSFEEGTWSPVGDCNADDDRTTETVGIRAERVPGGTDGRFAVELRARGHAACVSQVLRSSNLGPHLRLSLDYLHVRGAPPRVCVWQHGVDRCAALPPLLAGSGWQHFEGTLSVNPRTTALEVFLYADGRPGGTRARYDAVRLTRIEAGPFVALVPQGPEGPEGTRVIDTQSVSPVEHHVSVRGSSRPFVLVLDQTFDEGWILEGAQAVHTRVNGYANGWIVQAPDDAQLTIRYRPQIWLDRARLVSGVTVLALAAIGGWSLVKTMRERRKAKWSGSDRGNRRRAPARASD